jgi:hypothetical protein
MGGISQTGLEGEEHGEELDLSIRTSDVFSKLSAVSL